MFSEQLTFLKGEIFNIDNDFGFLLISQSGTKFDVLGYAFWVVDLVFECALKDWVLGHTDGDLGCGL